MPQTRDWQGMRAMSARLLEQRTGQGVEAWNRRVKAGGFSDEKSLRTWLAEQGVTGYAQSLLVMEHFGYPDFYLASADELIEGQYADRPNLRPIFDALLDAAASLRPRLRAVGTAHGRHDAARLGEVVIQTRKTYVSLVTPRRTFARIQPTTRTRLDLGLRLAGQKPGGRLLPCKIHESMQVQISLTAPEQVDEEVLDWLQKAYDQNV